MPIVTKGQLKLIHSMISPRRVTLVGLDVGTSNVGVALSDPSLKLALPQTTLRRKECPFLSMSITHRHCSAQQQPSVSISASKQQFWDGMIRCGDDR